MSKERWFDHFFGQKITPTQPLLSEREDPKMRLVATREVLQCCHCRNLDSIVA